MSDLSDGIEAILTGDEHEFIVCVCACGDGCNFIGYDKEEHDAHLARVISRYVTGFFAPSVEDAAEVERLRINLAQLQDLYDEQYRESERRKAEYQRALQDWSENDLESFAAKGSHS